MKRITRIWSTLLVSTGLITGMGVSATTSTATAAVAETASAATGTAYYVDCSATTNGTGTQGSPFNALTPVSAKTFAPGDQVLFKRGTSCNGRVELHGSGNAAAPIKVGAYGSGDLPKLIGDGTWATITIKNEQYWEFDSLDITNNGPYLSEPNPQKTAEKDRRRGIYVELKDYGTANHFVFQNLFVHDINGPRGWDGTSTGGIVLNVIGNQKTTHFNDVQVLNNHFKTVDYFGYAQWTTWRDRPELRAPDASGKFDPYTNVVIRGNLAEDLGADGLNPHQSVGAIIEHNIVRGYLTRDSGRCHVPLWAYNADDTLIQYNEVSGGQGTCDGTAFDLDGGANRQIIQYNYSHDNKGGFLTICGAGTSNDNIVRYNVSVNDGDKTFWVACGRDTNNIIHNNTIVLNNPALKPVNIVNNDNSSEGQDLKFFNNIFYIDPSIGADVKYGKVDGMIWDSNTFFGAHPAGEPTVDKNKLTFDPGFAGPIGGGPEAYKIKSYSSSAKSGLSIGQNGGKDYFGNALPDNCRLDRGAHQVTSNPTDCSSGNLALLRPTQMSSSLAGTTGSRAVDGNTDGTFRNGSVAHSSESPVDPKAWWQVDLGASKGIGSVKIFNRTDCCSTRLRNYDVFVSNNPFTSNDPAVTKTQAGVWTSQQAAAVDGSITLPVGVKGRYVRIQLEGTTEPLALAEVQVIGDPNVTRQAP